MTLEEYKQELVNSYNKYEEEIDHLRDRIYRLSEDKANAMDAIEEKYIQANRKYADGYVFATGRTIQFAFVEEDKICYRIGNNITVYQDDL